MKLNYIDKQLINCHTLDDEPDLSLEAEDNPGVSHVSSSSSIEDDDDLVENERLD